MQQWARADNRNPFMGIGNKICENPKYWCRLHEVWLSEEDAANKKCFCKPTFDLISVRKCGCIEVKERNPFVKYETSSKKNR